MNGALLTMVGVLSENGNDGAMLGKDFSRGVNELEGIKFVVVNTSDINFTHMDVKDVSIISYDATIGATNHKGTPFTA